MSIFQQWSGLKKNPLRRKNLNHELAQRHEVHKAENYGLR